MTNREAFVTALATLAATYDRKLTPAAIEGYWLALHSLTEHEFAKATERALRECEFMPVPARLLAYARAYRQDAAVGLETARQLKEIEAWKARDPKLLGAIRETVSGLASAKDANRPGAMVSKREPLVITDEEKRVALERLAATLAAREES